MLISEFQKQGLAKLVDLVSLLYIILQFFEHCIEAEPLSSIIRAS